MNKDQEQKQKLLYECNRVVIKVGSGVLTNEKFEGIDKTITSSIAKQISLMLERGMKVALVSSGSVTIGSEKMGIKRPNLSIPQKQAAAALGQAELIADWATQIKKYSGREVAQILLTHDDMANRRRFLNSRNTLNTILGMGAVPVINENDTVAVHEIKFGDNDTLAARVTNLIEADLLMILSDVDGLYSADPRIESNAQKIAYVHEVDEKIINMAGDSSTVTGLGGMLSKVRAAGEAARFGLPTVILPGKNSDTITRLLDGEDHGTFFFPHENRLSSKQHWIRFSLKSKGEIRIDDGAKKAVTEKGKSLLPMGIISVDGTFEAGEAVLIVDKDGAEIGKGLCNYHSFEVDKIKGEHTGRIEELLGYKIFDEVIHRNDTVFTF